MSVSFVQAEKLQPTPFEVEYFDQYDYYSLTDRYSRQQPKQRQPQPRKGIPPGSPPATPFPSSGCGTPVVHSQSGSGRVVDSPEISWTETQGWRKLSSSRKGRSKKEAEDHTNRPSPSGHERKIVLKLQRTEQKRKGTASKK